jgi:protein CpxP
MSIMRTVKTTKLLAFLAAIVFGCNAAFAAAAEPNASPHRNRAQAVRQGGRDYLQQLSEKLKLTDAQKAEIRPILAAEANEIRTVHQDSSLSAEQKQSKTKEIREANREKINALLTPEQQKIFAEMKEQAPARMQEAFNNRLNLLAKQLNLTNDQKAAIKPIIETEANDIRAVAQDNSLTREQRQTKIADIRAASDKKIDDLLTPEQQAKWAKIKERIKQQPNNKPAPGK